MSRQDTLLVGEVARPQGIRGELKVKPYTDDASRFLDIRTVLTDDGRTVQVLSARVQGDLVYLRLEGVSDRNEAERWRGRKLYVRREDAVPLGPDQWFIADLLDCRVEDDAGTPLGRLTDVLQNGAVDVFVITSEKGDTLVPARKALIERVDIDAGVIVVRRAALDETAVLP